uniref:60S ribosomal protein L37a n=1 Tax=Macrostomum lignano TaxID=282301 RepID=A0A1I8JNI7_9PLAT
MAKRTKKVGIVGKYATRYGASLRKTVKRLKSSSIASTPARSAAKTPCAVRLLESGTAAAAARPSRRGPTSGSTTAAVTTKGCNQASSRAHRGLKNLLADFKRNKIE